VLLHIANDIRPELFALFSRYERLGFGQKDTREFKRDRRANVSPDSFDLGRALSDGDALDDLLIGLQPSLRGQNHRAKRGSDC